MRATISKGDRMVCSSRMSSCIPFRFAFQVCRSEDDRLGPHTRGIGGNGWTAGATSLSPKGHSLMKSPIPMSRLPVAPVRPGVPPRQRRTHRRAVGRRTRPPEAVPGPPTPTTGRLRGAGAPSSRTGRVRRAGMTVVSRMADSVSLCPYQDILFRFIASGMLSLDPVQGASQPPHRNPQRAVPGP